MTARKNVLIVGGNFTNQGAYLMLSACAEHLRDEIGVQPVISMQTGSEREKRWLGLESLLDFPKLHLRVTGPRRGVLRRVRDRLPFVTRSEIDAVLDVSGFVYSDQWSHLDLDRRASALGWWRDRGVPVIMLPQAFGPFDETAKSVREAVGAAVAVFARDPDSRDYLSDVLDPEEFAKVDVSPDFTVLLKGAATPAADALTGRAPIVPNWNIADRAGRREEYLANLESCHKVLDERGLRPYGLCHEGAKDLRVLLDLRERIPNLEIVDGLNGRESKYVLSRSSFVVSGRFHALVSALSSGVPTLLHGWSHKYSWLASDYRCQEALADPYASGEAAAAQLVELLDRRSELATQISESAEVQKNLAREMWNAVVLELGVAAPVSTS